MKPDWHPKLGWHPLLSFGVLVGVVGGIFGLYQSKIFTVKHIICKTDQGNCPDYVQAELETTLGQSLFFTDFYKMGENITRLAPFLARFEINKKFPDTVNITFFAAQPSYVYIEKNGQSWIIDQAGYVIALADQNSSYPQVTAGSEVGFQPEVRERIDPQLHTFITATLESLQENHFDNIKFQLLSEQEGALELADGKKVIFKLAEARLQLTRLAYLLQHFSFSSLKEPIQEIDLRFSQVILRNTTALSANSAAAQASPNTKLSH